MENASKALIIAGAILLSIAIIGIGMYVYQMAADTITGGANMSEQEVTAFNAKFIKYEGIQNGSLVKGLVDVIRQHNANQTDESRQIIFAVGDELDGSTVNDDSAAGTDSAGLTTAKNSINAGTRYKITWNYTSAGLIKEIHATAQK